MKVMIDTNIIISAAITPNGNAAKAFIKAGMEERPSFHPHSKKEADACFLFLCAKR